LFLLGLFLNIDAILNKPMADVHERMPVGDDLRAALLCQSGPFGKHARLCKAQELGDWEAVEHFEGQCGIEARDVSRIYLEAVDKVFRSMQTLLEES